MKIFLIITIYIIVTRLTIQAQNDSLYPSKIYKTWISVKGEQKQKTGVLFEIIDSSIMISNSGKKEDYHHGRFELSKVDIRNIDILNLRKKNRTGNGAWIGSVTGAVLGGLVGIIATFATKPQTTSPYSIDLGPGADIAGVISVTLLSAGIGAIIGAAIGSHKIKIPVNGDQHEFDKNKSELNGYAIKSNLKMAGSDLGFSKIPDLLTDIDGNVYHTVALGGQVWMAENLAVTHYRDGSDISGIIRSPHGEGRQYNWYAVHHDISLCPAGWHIPSIEEWSSMVSSLGGGIASGVKMEEGFSLKEMTSQWWSSTEKDILNAQSLYLNTQTIGVMVTTASKTSDLDVRCLRN